MKVKLLVAGAFIAAATPVFAADLAPVPVEPVAPVIIPFTWEGFYIGAQIGYQWNSLDSTFAGAGIPGNNPDADGVVGGLYAGYNVQFNQIVLGLEADAELAGGSGDDSNGSGLTSFTDASENWQGSVRARLGYAFDNFLPYVTGGVAWSDWDFKSGPIGGPLEDYSDTYVGWTVGAGLEYAFTPNVIGRVEYRYSDFGDSSHDVLGVQNKVDLTSNAVRVGVSYKF